MPKEEEGRCNRDIDGEDSLLKGMTRDQALVKTTQRTRPLSPIGLSVVGDDLFGGKARSSQNFESAQFSNYKEKRDRFVE